MRLDLNGDNDYIDTDELDDDRQHNTANENTDRDLDTDGDGQYDDVLLDLVHDAVGNLTDDKSDYQYEYDVWGRLVRIRSQALGNPLVAEYEYNGINQRTGIHFDVDGDGTVENTSDDPWNWLAYDEGWRLLALFVDTDSAPTEEWVPHHAGLSGFGGASYIDDVILRDRDTDGNGSLDERIYYGQNWRHDVVAIVTDTGKMLEWIHYLSYGGMMAQPAGDNDFDFDFDATDDAGLVTPYHVVKDADLDGDIDSADSTHANGITGGYHTLGFGVISSTGVENRKGYAGYEVDHSNTIMYHVRHRVLNNKLGRWTRRDPLGYVDGANLYGYGRLNPLDGIDPFGRESWKILPKDPIYAYGSTGWRRTGFDDAQYWWRGRWFGAIVGPRDEPGNRVAVSADVLSVSLPKNPGGEVWRWHAKQQRATFRLRGIVVCDEDTGAWYVDRMSWDGVPIVDKIFADIKFDLSWQHLSETKSRATLTLSLKTGYSATVSYNYAWTGEMGLQSGGVSIGSSWTTGWRTTGNAGVVPTAIRTISFICQKCPDDEGGGGGNEGEAEEGGDSEYIPPPWRPWHRTPEPGIGGYQGWGGGDGGGGGGFDGQPGTTPPSDRPPYWAV